MTKEPTLCSAEGCKTSVYGLNFCQKHYRRNYRYSSPHVLRKQHKYHGGTGTSEYVCWKHIKARCMNPNSNVYSYYGGRGISVCKRWSKSFANFLSDMGSKPSASHSIDRLDVDGNYCPSNCRWATKIQQNRNRRGSNKTSRFKGVSKNVRGLWESQIWFKGRSCWLGYYSDEKDAAIAYNVAVQILFGSDCYLNHL